MELKFEKIVNEIRGIIDKNRADMQSIPRRLNPQDIPECVDTLLRLGNSIVRARVALKIIELAETFDMPQRDKLQIQYYKEIVKENVLSIWGFTSKIMDTILDFYPVGSFENAIFQELKKILEGIYKADLPTAPAASSS